MELLPDTQNRGLCMRREWRERFPRRRGLAIPTCITARAWRTCRDAFRDRLQAVSLEVGSGENLPGIPGACAKRNFTFLVRGLCFWSIQPQAALSFTCKLKPLKIHGCNDEAIPVCIRGESEVESPYIMQYSKWFNFSHLLKSRVMWDLTSCICLPGSSETNTVALYFWTVATNKLEKKDNNWIFSFLLCPQITVSKRCIIIKYELGYIVYDSRSCMAEIAGEIPWTLVPHP